MKSIEHRHELSLEKRKSIKTESLDVALAGRFRPLNSDEQGHCHDATTPRRHDAAILTNTIK
jgi:hypothetical protein